MNNPCDQVVGRFLRKIVPGLRLGPILQADKAEIPRKSGAWQCSLKIDWSRSMEKMWKHNKHIVLFIHCTVLNLIERFHWLTIHFSGLFFLTMLPVILLEVFILTGGTIAMSS